MRLSAAFWLPCRCSVRIASNHISGFFTTLRRPCSRSARALVLRNHTRLAKLVWERPPVVLNETSG